MALSNPSSPDPVYTPCTARGAKLAALLVDEGTALVRKIFEDEIQNMSPPSLHEQLMKHKGHLYRNHIFIDKEGTNQRANLNRGQKKTLYPVSGMCNVVMVMPVYNVPDTAQGFDISLLELLLKVLVWLELGRDALYSGERDRLRQFRNDNYGHRPRTDLAEEDFNKLWKELSDILVALGGDRDKISERLDSSIDPELAAEYFNLLGKLHEEEMELRDLILAQGESLRQGLHRVESLLMEPPWLQQVRANQSADSSHNAEPTPGPFESADDVIACLKDLYATEYAHVRPLPWCEDFNLHLGEVFTNLQLQYRDGRGRFQDTDTIVSLADIYNTRAVEGSQVNVGPYVRKIRVEGDPGIGKSCSCQKLAYDWSCGKLARFQVVFFLEMRHLAGKVKDEIFEQLLPKDSKTTPDQLWSYIQENQDDALFILDGLDELSQTVTEVTDVVDLIKGKILRNCHVLVTSRPYHCVTDLEKCHRFYKIVGYTKENSEEFIHKYFCKSPESGLELVEQLRRNSILSEIVVNPLNNVLICVVWEDNNNELPSNKDNLYRDIVDSVAKRFCKKRYIPIEGDILPPHIEEALQGLGKLSWEGLEQEQLQFSIDEITKTYGTTADNMLNMGLLTRDYSFSRIRRTCYCAFLHKTFQEYMAARYISGLVMDGSSREEGMKCVCSLFGMSDDTVENKELIMYCQSKYREVQNWLLLVLGVNSPPLFEKFAEQLSKFQTDEDREFLSFFCIMWLGTTYTGGELAEIVAPFLSQHATNNVDVSNKEIVGCKDWDFKVPIGLCWYETYNEGGLMVSRDDHANWCVGLAHVLTFQKKHGTSFIQHLTINCKRVNSAQQEKIGMLENALSDYDAMRSVTLLGMDDSVRTYSLVRKYVPGIGTESVYIRSKCPFSYLSLLSTLEQLSAVAKIEHVTAQFFIDVSSNLAKQDREHSKFDRQLARMIESQTRLRSLRLEILCRVALHTESDAKTFDNLTATLQSISEHTRLEAVEFKLPVIYDAGYLCAKKQHETLNVESLVDMLTECVKNNKVLKTLRIRWKIDVGLLKTCRIYGDCSSQSLSSLCSAIRENRTLETLVVEGMISHTECRAAMISEMEPNKPSNYKELSITLSDSIHDDAFHDDNDTSDDDNDTSDDDNDTSDDDTFYADNDHFDDDNDASDDDNDSFDDDNDNFDYDNDNFGDDNDNFGDDNDASDDDNDNFDDDNDNFGDDNDNFGDDNDNFDDANDASDDANDASDDANDASDDDNDASDDDNDNFDDDNDNFYNDNDNFDDANDASDDANDASDDDNDASDDNDNFDDDNDNFDNDNDNFHNDNFDDDYYTSDDDNDEFDDDNDD